MVQVYIVNGVPSRLPERPLPSGPPTKECFLDPPLNRNMRSWSKSPLYEKVWLRKDWSTAAIYRAPHHILGSPPHSHLPRHRKHRNLGGTGSRLCTPQSAPPFVCLGLPTVTAAPLRLLSPPLSYSGNYAARTPGGPQPPSHTPERRGGGQPYRGELTSLDSRPTIKNGQAQ